MWLDNCEKQHDHLTCYSYTYLKIGCFHNKKSNQTMKDHKNTKKYFSLFKEFKGKISLTCEMTDIAWRNVCSLSSLMGYPSIRTVPFIFPIRNNMLNKELFPDPVRPTIPTCKKKKRTRICIIIIYFICYMLILLVITNCLPFRKVWCTRTISEARMVAMSDTKKMLPHR